MNVNNRYVYRDVFCGKYLEKLVT